MNKISSFQTKRLLIRNLTMDDVEPWLEFLQGENSLEFLPFTGPTIEHSKKWIEKQLNRYKDDGHGLMALVDKDTGRMVGQCGLLKQEIDGNVEIEIGYHIVPVFRGKGYATEAAIAFKKLAFKKKMAASIISIIHVDNIKSQKVAERNGMKRDYITRDLKLIKDVPHYVYRIKLDSYNN